MTLPETVLCSRPWLVPFHTSRLFSLVVHQMYSCGVWIYEVGVSGKGCGIMYVHKGILCVQFGQGVLNEGGFKVSSCVLGLRHFLIFSWTSKGRKMVRNIPLLVINSVDCWRWLLLPLTFTLLVYESFKDYVAVETLKEENKYDAGDLGMQVCLGIVL